MKDKTDAYTLPSRCGISLKAEHYKDIINTQPDIGWLEIHPENYMGAGGPPHRYLEAIRKHYPLSLHGVGMSLGSTDGVSIEHLIELKKLIQRYQPAQVSEHISWSHWNQIYLNDLLPLPYTKESLKVVCDNLDQVQSFIGQQILVENPSSYIDYRNSDFTETEFITEVCKVSGCGLLLDINNVYVSASNNGFDPYHYLDSTPITAIAEIHLAGHSIKSIGPGKHIRIDDHGSAVKPEVWMLFDTLLQKLDSPPPTLIEWDTDIPPLSELIMEARKAEYRLNTLPGHRPK